RGDALAKAPQVRIAALDLGQIAPPARQRRHVAALAALRDRALEIRAHSGMAREELLEILLRFLGRDRETAREPERGDAVDHGEVRGLGDVALRRGHMRRIDAEDLGSRAAVDVLAAPEGLHQALLTRHVSEDPELDLRVVRREEPPARLGDERRTDAAPELGA